MSILSWFHNLFVKKPLPSCENAKYVFSESVPVEGEFYLPKLEAVMVQAYDQFHEQQVARREELRPKIQHAIIDATERAVTVSLRAKEDESIYIVSNDLNLTTEEFLYYAEEHIRVLASQGINARLSAYPNSLVINGPQFRARVKEQVELRDSFKRGDVSGTVPYR